MDVNLPDLQELESIVRDGAGRHLMPMFGRARFDYKDDGSIITPADEAMQQHLVNALEARWPEYAILGEEMPAGHQARAMACEAGYWCVDPLDGTNNYAAGMPCFSVSVALIVGGVQKLGLVYDPVREEAFTAVSGEGARLNGAAIRVNKSGASLQNTIAEIDMKRLPGDLAVRLVTEGPFSSQRNIGSSALDWCWLAAGRYDIYLHGAQKLWDYSAGNLVLHEAGGVSTALDGEAVFRGRLESRSVLASLNTDLFRYWCEWIGIRGMG